MIITDESALICDLAETYNIYDYKSLPVLMVATFCIGLRENSRIKLKLNNSPVSLETLLLSVAVDRLGLLLWTKSKDAEKGKGKPKSFTNSILGVEKENETIAFESADEFEKARLRIIGKVA
ncbi:hypothetical protein DWZ53_08900 [Coprobacillus sp. AF33-1AC]|nr:hypothetical protein DWZ53_08900 [Coprobacillus sp. AF33-1AC]